MVRKSFSSQHLFIIICLLIHLDLDKPRITLTLPNNGLPKKLNFWAEETVIFYCRVRSHALPKFMWFKGEKQIGYDKPGE